MYIWPIRLSAATTTIIIIISLHLDNRIARTRLMVSYSWGTAKYRWWWRYGVMPALYFVTQQTRRTHSANSRSLSLPIPSNVICPNAKSNHQPPDHYIKNHMHRHSVHQNPNILSRIKTSTVTPSPHRYTSWRNSATWLLNTSLIRRFAAPLRMSTQTQPHTTKYTISYFICERNAPTAMLACAE